MSCEAWGVILAGGDGTRLRRISRLVSGDDRPKQFCALFGGESLLMRTRNRTRRVIRPDHTLFTVVKNHRQFYESDLADAAESQIVVQPSNRGTTAAIVYSLFRISQDDPDATVAFFPADHYFSNEELFIRTVERALGQVERHPELLVLLGAKAERAEVEFGWIEPGRPLPREKRPKDKDSARAFEVKRFWEKPAPAIARALLGRGCLWNTFVLIGKVRIFLDVVRALDPKIVESFQSVAAAGTRETEAIRVYMIA